MTNDTRGKLGITRRVCRKRGEILLYSLGSLDMRPPRALSAAHFERNEAQGIYDSMQALAAEFSGWRRKPPSLLELRRARNAGKVAP